MSVTIGSTSQLGCKRKDRQMSMGVLTGMSIGCHHLVSNLIKYHWKSNNEAPEKIRAAL
jgi:hypothetical protein